MKTFRDFLVWYNNLDVEPFVEAVENFQQFYFEKSIDVFKTAISVPGIARQLLFRTARKENANFALFDKQNEDLYQTIKHNIVGVQALSSPVTIARAKPVSGAKSNVGQSWDSMPMLCTCKL